MSVFDNYGKYYDLLNEAKEYDAEADYVSTLISDRTASARRILELGCGTGGHAVPLAAKGYSVSGIDLSTAMIERAEARRAGLATDHASRLDFTTGDLRHYRSHERFDAVISLFHVISYQPTNEDLALAFDTARAHLDPGGLFLFDCWYGPAVLTDPPYVRAREFRNERLTATRTAQPTLHPNRNLVQVDFAFVVKDSDGHAVDEFSEQHWMRYLFLPEIEDLLDRCGFELTAAFEWMTADPPGLGSWYVVVIAKAV